MVKQQHSARQHRSTRYSIGPPDRSTRGSGRISYEKSQGHGTPETLPSVSFSSESGGGIDTPADAAAGRNGSVLTDSEEQQNGSGSGRSETPDSVNRVLFQEGTTFHRVDPTKDSALYLGKSRRGRNLTALKSTGSLIEDDEANGDDNGITSDEDDDDDEDTFEDILGMRPNKGPSPERRKSKNMNQQHAGRESPVKAPCVDLHISPNFSELFKVFEKPRHQGKLEEKQQPKEVESKDLVVSDQLIPATASTHTALVISPRSMIPNTTSPSLEMEDAISTTSTEITSNTMSAVSHRIPQMTLLQRELDTLKNIMREDSLRQLMVKKELEACQEEQTRLLAELVLEKDAADLLRRERDLQREQETQHKETIQLLKQEVDQLTCYPEDLERLKRENELFALQIVESESELKQLRDKVEELEHRNKEKPLLSSANDKTQILRLAQKNTLLEQEVKELQDQLRQQPPPPPPPLPDQKKQSSLSSDDAASLVGTVSALESRLKAIEEERELARQTQEDKKHLLEQELESIKTLLRDKHSDDHDEHSRESVEVTVEETKMEEKVPEEETNDKRKEGGDNDDDEYWEPLCGCLVSGRDHTPQVIEDCKSPEEEEDDQKEGGK